MVPDFEMGEDGTVFLNGDGSVGIDRLRLSEEGIEEVHGLLARIDPDADYGEVDWTDGPTTSVSVNRGGEAFSFDVYWLRSRDERTGEWNDVDGGDLVDELSDDQVDARLELLDVLGELDALADQADEPGDLVAEPRQPYVPDRVEVVLSPFDEGDGDVASLGGAVEWPSSHPLTEASLGVSGSRLCTVVEGDAAAAVAALVEEPGAQPRPWTTGAAAESGLPALVEVDVRGLLPDHDPRCDLGATPDRLDVVLLGSVELADPAGWDGSLPADRFEQATALDAFAVAPIVAAGMESHRDSLPVPYDCEFDTERAYPEGQCQVDGELRPIPESLRVPAGAELTYYDYRLVVAVLGGTRYLDLEAYTPAGTEPPHWETRATTWRTRIDLTTQTLPTIELD